MDVGDHFPKLAWVLVPRIIAAFFKMSFSALSRAFSRRRERRSSACGPLAYGSLSFATDLHSLRLQLPFVEQVAGPEILLTSAHNFHAFLELGAAIILLRHL